MSERPILFSGAMVRALLAGTKTQTRRVVKPQPHILAGELLCWKDDALTDDQMAGLCPHGKPGDRLWVREAWQYAGFTEDGYPFVRYSADNARRLHDRSPSEAWSECWVDIWAGLSEPSNFDIDGTASDRRWRPSIHMPRWASRITLEITGVRVERLQDISEADAEAEGIERDGMGWRHYLRPGRFMCTDPRMSYQTLWESINGPGSWDANPLGLGRRVQARGAAAVITARQESPCR